jgi:hypothetical protein
VIKQLDEQTNTVIDQRYRTTATILFSQIFSVILLTVVSIFIAGQVQPFGATSGQASFSVGNLAGVNGGTSTLTTFLWIVILALAIMAFFLRRMIFAPGTLRDTATIKGASGLIQSLQTKTIFLSSVGEAIAILGFVISLASGNYTDMMRAALVAVIIFFINFPRKSSWQKLALSATG